MQEIIREEAERKERIRRLRLRRRKVNFLLCVVMLVMSFVAAAGGVQGKGGDEAGEQTESPKIIITMWSWETEGQREGEEEAFPTSSPGYVKDSWIYGCDLIGVYEYPFNTMSQDWDGAELEGFRYHEISAEAKAAGGYFPPIAQIYTYIVCKQRGVDYEMVFALIEQESKCRYDAEGDGGESIGYMQIQEKEHRERMKRLGAGDLKNPFQNIRVGVDILAELQEMVAQEETETPEADVLAAYNYGLQGARVHLWANGVHLYSYNQAILDRAEELRQDASEGV